MLYGCFCLNLGLAIFTKSEQKSSPLEVCIHLWYTISVSLEILKECIGFQWDNGNSDKNWVAHQVTKSECEQIFFNHPLFVENDEKHSKSEVRFYALGKTDSERKLFIVFTIRKNLIRVISARDMSKKERGIY